MRIARYTPPGMVHHVVSRFIDREWLIKTPDERTHYLRLLGNAMARTDWLCIAYAIMSSHIHLAMVAGRMPAESWSRRVNPPFANWFNECHQRIGPLFAERASMWIGRAHDVAALIAYIHNNPVRGGVEKRAIDSTWTSHRAYLQPARAPGWLAVNEGLRLSGLQADEFDSWVHSQRHVTRDDPALQPISRAAKRRGALELGTPTRDPLEVPLVARPFAHIRPDPSRIVELTGEVIGVELGELRSRSRDPLTVAGRAIAIRAGKAFGVPMSSTAAALGISAQAGARLGGRSLDSVGTAALTVVRDRLEAALTLRFRKEKASPSK